MSDRYPPSGGHAERPDDPGKSVDYRAVPSPLAALSDGDRRVAWAIVRALATAAWWAGVVLSIAWLAAADKDESFRDTVRLAFWVPAAVALVVAGVLEYYARVLRPARAR